MQKRRFMIFCMQRFPTYPTDPNRRCSQADERDPCHERGSRGPGMEPQSNHNRHALSDFHPHCPPAAAEQYYRCRKSRQMWCDAEYAEYAKNVQIYRRMQKSGDVRFSAAHLNSDARRVYLPHYSSQLVECICIDSCHRFLTSPARCL